MASRSGDAARVTLIARDLEGRATSYAENAIEGLNLVTMSGDVHSDPRPLEDIVTADMELVTAALARAYVMGYAAAMDDETRPTRTPEAFVARAVRRRRRARRG